LSATPAAEELRNIRLGGDVEFCLQRDRYRDVLPFYLHDQDIFISHQVHYDIPVHYETARKPGPAAGLSDVGAARVIQVYFIWQDDESDAFFERASASGGKDSSFLASSVGEQEAARRRYDLVNGFDWTEVALVASSPSHRCRTMAEQVRRKGELVEIYSGLAAVDSGDWAGLSLEEVRQHYPGDVARWHSDPDWGDHGGESFRQVHNRATSMFESLLQSYLRRGLSGGIVVATHSTLVHHILATARGFQLEEAAAFAASSAVALQSQGGQPDSVTLVEVSVPLATQEDPSRIPAGLRFRVTDVGRGPVPMALSSRLSRL